MMKTLKKANKRLSEEGKDSERLTERVYLYYLQHGKCMYSGKPLDFDKLSEYQVDHIIPQSYIKDDSIDNKVLVLGNENQYKGDQLLLSQNIINKRREWWESLHKNGLMSSKKYRNLTRPHLSDMEELGFINRQLVETRQITKHVANLFKNYYLDTNIVSIRAELTHNFREKFELYKIRELNDYHHAQDAFVVSIVGSYVMKKYPVLQKEFIFTEYQQIPELRKKLQTKTKNGYGFVLNQMNNDRQISSSTGELVWDGDKTISYIVNAFQYKDCFITKKTEEKRGQFFDLTLQKKEEIQKAIKENPHKVIPVNSQRKDITKYGGYIKLQYGYCTAVEYKVKNKIKREVINIPIMLMDAPEEKLREYLISETKDSNVMIIKSKLLLNQLFEYQGGLFFMASAAEWNNAKQLILSRDSQKTIYSLLNPKVSDPTNDEISKFFDEYISKLETYSPLYKGVAEKIKSKKELFLSSENKVQLTKELLNITKASSKTGNLKELQLSSELGRLTKKTLNLDEAKFIFQSVTGMYSYRKKF